MEPVNEQLIERIDSYIQCLFSPPDDALLETLRDSDAAGLPSISISANQGKLLYLIARIARVQRILEIGTLGGYSTTWLARALENGGSLITLELDPKHADVARKNLERTGMDDRVEIRVGRAADLLRAMIECREEPFDLVFIDADKPGYVEYLNLALQLSHSGTIVLADNLIRHGQVLDEAAADQNARAARSYSAAIASNPGLESILVPVFKNGVDGMSISVVK